MTDDDQRWNPDKVRLDVARDLSSIETMYGHLMDEAIAKADDAHEFPGGDAMNLMGPVANLEAWQHRYDAAEARAFASDADMRAGHDYVYDQVDTEDHPLLVLATWEDAIREERDQPTDLRATVTRAAAYIRSSLDWMLGTNEFGDLNFLGIDALEVDLRRVRHRLETVLHDGVRTERGAPCLHCRSPLEREQSARTGLLDSYRCKGCGRFYSKSQYDYAIGVTYLHHSPTLTAAQIEEREGIEASKVRVWGCRYEGLKTGKRTPEGRLLYDVAAVVARRDELAETA